MKTWPKSWSQIKQTTLKTKWVTQKNRKKIVAEETLGLYYTLPSPSLHETKRKKKLPKKNFDVPHSQNIKAKPFFLIYLSFHLQANNDSFKVFSFFSLIFSQLSNPSQRNWAPFL